MPKEFVVAFSLAPAGQAATASSFKFTWKGSTPQKFERCLTKIWSETQFGLILKDTVSISMPVQLN